MFHYAIHFIFAHFYRKEDLLNSEEVKCEKSCHQHHIQHRAHDDVDDRCK